MIEQLLGNPIYYIAAITGLILAACISISSGFFLMAVTFQAVKTAALRRTFKKVAKFLVLVAIRNEQVNPDLSALARGLLKTLDPSSSLHDGDMAELRELLNMPELAEPDTPTRRTEP